MEAPTGESHLGSGGTDRRPSNAESISGHLPLQRRSLALSAGQKLALCLCIWRFSIASQGVVYPQGGLERFDMFPGGPPSPVRFLVLALG